MAEWKKVIVSGSAAELASLSLGTALPVSSGGTGVSTLTDGGVLLGSGTGAVTSLGQATNGQLVIGSTGADPVLATLTGGSNITVTNTAGSISIAATGLGSGTVTSVDTAGTVNGLTLTGGEITTTGTITLGGTLANIANSALTNSTVSYGGVQLSLGGSDATPAFNLSDATSLPLGTGTTGTLATTRGGTGLISYTTGDIIYSSAGNTLAKLGIGTAGQVLTVAGGVVSWATPTTGDITSIASGSGITITDGTGPIPTVAIDYVGANNIILEAQDLSASTIETTDKIMFSDGSSEVSFANVSDLPFTNNTGDVESVANATNGGMSVTNGGGADVTLAVDINNLGEASIASGDFIAFSDEGAVGDPTKKESIDDVATLFAGTGLSAASAVMSVDYGSSAGDAVEGNTTITVNVAAGELTRDAGSAAQALGGGPSYTLGLADTISGNRTFSGDTITINNDLIVQGTASFQSTTNLEVADQFILLNSGSSTDNSPGGIVIQQNVQDEGVLFGYDAAAHANDGRWGVTSSFDASGTTFTADAYVSYVIDIDAGQSDIALYQNNGNIKVDSGDIFIYA
tara:strand:- start:122 stop:1843 length:1722 start_codon:yes stop_codon:yes gene_type:complete